MTVLLILTLGLLENLLAFSWRKAATAVHVAVWVNIALGAGNSTEAARIVVTGFRLVYLL